MGGTWATLPRSMPLAPVVTWSFVLIGVMMVLFSTMRAYGAVYAPLVIMFVALYPGRIGFYTLAYPHIGQEAVWWSFPVGSVISAVSALLYYLYGPWRSKVRARLTAAAAE